MAEPARVDTADRGPWAGGSEHPPHSKDASVFNGQEPPNIFAPKTRTASHDSSTTFPKPGQKHHSPYAVNGKPSSRNSSRSRTRSRQDSSAHDQRNLQPPRLDAIGRKESNLSRTGSEPDSLLDLYGRESANRSATSVLDATNTTDDRGDRTPQSMNNGDPNNTFWIHRDKLAKIESEELQQLGIYVPQSALRGTSKHSRGRTRSRDSQGNVTNGSIDQADQTQQQRSVDNDNDGWTTTAPSAANEKSSTRDEPDHQAGSPVVFEDPRLPEEIAADPYEDGSSSPVYRMPVLRKSTSKIPVLSSGRLLSQEHLPTESPAQRSRTNTVVGGDEKTASSHVKRRSASEPAPLALDAAGSESAPAETTPPQSSRSRIGDTSQQQQQQEQPSSPPAAPKSPAKPASATRKTSAPPNNRKPMSNQKSKSPTTSTATNSATTTNQRPKTRSGDRPSTAVNRPEGDPPWLATMYKPDPRLPPDQQMLPTHARKLAQEQWENEGKVPTTYDREFAPLAVQDDTAAPQRPAEPKKSEERRAPELKPPSPEMKKSPDLINRPGTSGTDRGGYKTVPTIQHTRTTSITAGPPPRPMAVEEPSSGKKKSCGCCVVM